MFIPEDKVTDIRNAADIVEIISESVLLKKAGKDYVGLCPFHSEKTPSFTVSPEKQIFYCFGCGTGGNVFSFLMKQEGFSFPEAVRMLARRYGIDIPAHAMSPEQKRRMNERERLFDINKQAMEYFRQALRGDSGKKAMAYLDARGMTTAVIEGFNLGYAPDGWNNLINFFSEKGTPLSLVEKAGLIIPKNSGNGFYDRFRDRIIFPIIDVRMQVIGFGGRVMDDTEQPKYLNSPETPLYKKSRSLYGLHRAKQKCRQSDAVYLVEGYLDVLSLHKHGIENAVATLGTALTPEHIRLLRGYARKMTLVYDSDEAGVRAARRSTEIFRKEETDASVLVLQPAGYDPDSYLAEFGTDAFINAASQSLSLISFLTDSAIKKHGLSTEGKIRIISDMEAPLSTITDNVARSLYIRELSERTEIDEAEILKKIRRVSSSHKTAVPYKLRTDTLRERGDKLEQKIIAMMLQFPEILPEIGQRNILEHFKDDTLKSIGQIILDCPGKKLSEIDALSGDEEKGRIVFPLAIEEEPWNREGCLNLIEQFESGRKGSISNWLTGNRLKGYRK
ncbi:DNA primase [Desulfonema magnum]|uniref:DNA primase n=1 Tax=Desulfonema magnum TaxID=45655 RepID=UPI001FEC4F27|nr:DNA primase [Desulfonema magnum]